MTTSIFLAQVIGLLYLAFGLGALFNPTFYYKVIHRMTRNLSVVFLGGIMAIVTGVAITSYHNIWVADWRIIITIIGWAALVKGLLLFILPKALLKFSRKTYKNKSFITVVGIGSIILGAILGYYGFIV